MLLLRYRYKLFHVFEFVCLFFLPFSQGKKDILVLVIFFLILRLFT